MKLTLRSLLGAGVFAVAFVLNPLYFAGCGASEPEPNFGEAEMLGLYDRVDTGTWSFETGGSSYELSLVLNRATATVVARAEESFTQSAHACGDRTFFQSAAACITVTSVPVVGTVTLVRVVGEPRTTVAENVAIEGSIDVYGDALQNAMMTLTLGETTQLLAFSSPAAMDFELTRVLLTDVGAEALDIDYP